MASIAESPPVAADEQFLATLAPRDLQCRGADPHRHRSAPDRGHRRGHVPLGPGSDAAADRATGLDGSGAPRSFPPAPGHDPAAEGAGAAGGLGPFRRRHGPTVDGRSRACADRRDRRRQGGHRGRPEADGRGRGHCSTTRRGSAFVPGGFGSRPPATAPTPWSGSATKGSASRRQCSRRSSISSRPPVLRRWPERRAEHKVRRIGHGADPGSRLRWRCTAARLRHPARAGTRAASSASACRGCRSRAAKTLFDAA